MTVPSPLAQAIAQLEALRSHLGDAAVDAAIDALQRNSPAAPSAPPTPAAPPRVRQVSILFADVVGSTTMLGQVDDEDAARLLDVAVQSFAEAVQTWGGQVLRYTGDGIKAGFGVEGLREDEAERAVRAGLQILRMAEQHAAAVARELGVREFGVRVGIHTGPVLLGGGFEAERSAIGQAVHLAARMEQSAPPGRLRVSDATWALVRGLFTAQAQPPLRVKGHEAPLRTWLVTGAASGADLTVQRGVDGVAPPMIGRDTELARLVAWHADIGTTGRRGAALVLAEAGVGKTRLRRELAAALGLGNGSAGLLLARAQPSGRLQPYGLLRQLLAHWLHLRDDLPADEARRELLAGLAPWLRHSEEDGAGPAGDAEAGARSEAGSGAVIPPRPPRSERDAALIGQLVGFDFADHPAVSGLPPAQLRAQAFAALHRALAALARAAPPLLLVLDDLQWSDEGSLDFIRSELMAPAAAAPGQSTADEPLSLAALLLARPALRSERGFEPGPGTLVIELQALAAGAAEALVDALLQPLPSPPESLRRLLTERAQGNPFYAEALVRMLIDDGVIDVGALPWRLREGELAALRIPDTVLGVLQARLDALPASELLVLQDASIVGPVFWEAALAALNEAGPQAVPALQRRALVVPRGSSALAATREHAFSHHLLHEATYGSVLKPQRRAGHAQVAEWLAQRAAQGGGIFRAVIADHYERAGDSANALTHWDVAHQDAYARYANADALAFAERALAQPALTDPAQRYWLLNGRYNALDRMGRKEPATAAARDLHDWAEAHGGPALQAHAAAVAMMRADAAGQRDQAREHAGRALALAQTPGAVAEGPAAWAHGEMAWLALQQGHHDRVAHHLAQGLEIAVTADRRSPRDGGLPGISLRLRVIEIESLSRQDRFLEALQTAQAALAELDRRPHVLQDRYNFTESRHLAEHNLGRHAAALVSAQAGVAIAREMGIASALANALIHTARAALALRDLELAGQALHEAEPILIAVDQDRFWASWLDQQADLARLQGDLPGARDFKARAVPRFEARGMRLWRSTRCGLAAIDLALGDADEALAAVDAVLVELAAETGPDLGMLDPEGLVDAHTVLHAAGDPRAADLRATLRLRLEAQLQALPDDEARRLLLDSVTWRGAVAALTSG